MWTDIFFDSNNNFQWAGVAAIASLLAFITSATSIYVTHFQGRKNRESSTLIKLRIDELREIREISYKLNAHIDKYIENKRKIYSIGNYSIDDSDEIRNEIMSKLDEIHSYLFKITEHEIAFSTTLSTIQLKAIHLKSHEELVEIRVDLIHALMDYSHAEYKSISESL